MFSVLRISDPSLSASQQSDYAQKYTDLRITALERSPHAFSTTVAIESQLNTSQRLARLREPQKTIFVCISDATGDWVGQVTLIGPMTRSEYDASFQILPGTQSAQSPSLDDDPNGAYWHMTALYVDDRIRGRGLARLLCDKCFDYIGTGQLRILIKPDNTAVIEMYKYMGFEVLDAKTTLLEAIHASRDSFDRVPEDAKTDPAYTTRSGIVMIKRLQSSSQASCEKQ
ncbi:GNAT domain protein [Kalmanozyma brasiliensis GHG001]|uniref:N-acetyltransferase domain-containing protein n=1 Tax=Kalmanozyma brasiliensis (strain GHG001) TaxID=1365824 RepID=V5EZS7_KALBG|nr:GNAT domain protein [Kalmanozyma brasiliensis GHG001]EST08414.1 GNAT domain protein [Kalmanozyma brasiliensis GHG001]